MNHTIQKLSEFDAIDLAGLEQKSALLTRKETKYLIHKDQLNTIMSDLIHDYNILEIKDQRIFGYDSCYFDSQEQWCYQQHHQGKRLRAKIRTRAYLQDDSLTFFEVKLKKQTQTHKYRLAIPRKEHGSLSATSQQFLTDNYSRHYNKIFDVILQSSLSISYQRITLVHKTANERLTIDFGLGFYDSSARHDLVNTVIIESKSDISHGPSKAILHTHGIRTIGKCSKYCIASILLKNVKNNNFRDLEKKIREVEIPPPCKAGHLPY